MTVNSSITPSLLVQIGIWLVLWIVSWRVFYGPMSRHRINYVDHFGLTAAYFLFLAILAALIFREPLLPIAGTVTHPPIIVLAAMISAQLSLYYLSRRFLQKPLALIDRHPQEFFLTFDYRYLFSKAFEVLYQQAMIVALILTIDQVARSLTHVVIIYAVVFSLGHIPMLKLFGGQAKSFAWFYVVAAIASSIVFPPLVLKVDGGFIYAYVIHSFFYTLLAEGFWVKNTVAQNN
jgi:hypothetical protein